MRFAHTIAYTATLVPIGFVVGKGIGFLVDIVINTHAYAGHPWYNSPLGLLGGGPVEIGFEFMAALGAAKHALSAGLKADGMAYEAKIGGADEWTYSGRETRMLREQMGLWPGEVEPFIRDVLWDRTEPAHARYEQRWSGERLTVRGRNLINSLGKALDSDGSLVEKWRRSGYRVPPVPAYQVARQDVPIDPEAERKRAMGALLRGDERAYREHVRRFATAKMRAEEAGNSAGTGGRAPGEDMQDYAEAMGPEAGPPQPPPSQRPRPSAPPAFRPPG